VFSWWYNFYRFSLRFQQIDICLLFTEIKPPWMDCSDFPQPNNDAITCIKADKIINSMAEESVRGNIKLDGMLIV
jgi:hypothetical protein